MDPLCLLLKWKIEVDSLIRTLQRLIEACNRFPLFGVLIYWKLVRRHRSFHSLFSVSKQAYGCQGR